MKLIQMPSEENIRGVYHQGVEAVVKVFEELSGIIVTLTVHVTELEDQLTKNSSNSGKPPSSDGYEKPAPKSRRKRSGKKSGGQAGHKGYTLKAVAKPNVIEVHKVSCCSNCEKSLKGVKAVSVEKRQVFDLPEIRLQVTEHQAEIKVCPGCQKQIKASFPLGVNQAVQYGNRIKSQMTYLYEYQLLSVDRTQEMLKDLYGQNVAEGTILSACKELAQQAAPVQQAVKEHLTYKTKVAGFDESGARVEGKLNWFHVTCTKILTYYAVHAKRGKIAMNEIGILPNFKGRAIHDDLPSYFHYLIRHGLCNAHHLRSLEFLLERYPQSWVKKLIDLLLEIKSAVEKALAKGKTRLSAKRLADFSSRYDMLLKQGFKLNPAQAKPTEKAKRGRPKQSFAKNLLDRLYDHKEAVLAFMVDFNVPFENNQAERDIRMRCPEPVEGLKVRQKISGCFRSQQGAEIFCVIRGYISTARKNKQSVLDVLHSAFSGIPYYPDFIAHLPE